MKKSIYLAAIAAIALSACSNDSNEIFDQSAAERLEAFKTEYADVLTADGGLWTMEYFSNEEEPGYLFVVKFDKDGSVKFSANHKWIGNEFKEETSLWTMIADNGPVLSFNSYNDLFHIFSDPANITGVEAPKGDDNEDIDETGFGHEGDYEFQIMEVSEDKNTVRMLGKKRLYHIYLRRLDPSTDVKAYMDEYKEIEKTIFNKDVPNFLMFDSKGEEYVVKGAYTGVMKIYPKNGDEVDQTRSCNFILTKSGIRFRDPLEVVNAADEAWNIEEFKFVGNYGLASVSDESVKMNFGKFSDIVDLNSCNWRVDLKNMDGGIKDAFNRFADQLKQLYNYKSASVNEFTIDYNVAQKSYIARIYVRTGSKSYETDRFYLTFTDGEDGGVKLTLGEAFDESSALAYNAYTELQNIFNMLTASSMQFTSTSDCGPKTVYLKVGDGTMPMTASR